MTTYRNSMGPLLLALSLLASGGCEDDDGGSSARNSCAPAAANVGECFGGLISEDEARELCEEGVAMASSDGEACEQALTEENECIANVECEALLAGECDAISATVDEACPSLARSNSGDGSCPFTEDNECDEPEGTNLCDEGTDVADCS